MPSQIPYYDERNTNFDEFVKKQVEQLDNPFVREEKVDWDKLFGF